MASKLFPSLAATAFAAMLFHIFLKRRSREIDAREANNNADLNNGREGGDSGTPTSTEVPEMPSSSGYDYEVFLSFRGPETRSAFTDFLYTGLDRARIRTFKDDESLRVGEQFEPKLLQAINQSKILIPIFSKGYASSEWCLKELVQMVECEKTGRQKIMPIFYDVAPSEVRRQTGGYGEALRSHEKKGRIGKEIISQWKAALSAVSAINGSDLHSNKDTRQEGKFVETFTQMVLNELKKTSLAISDDLVGVDHHVDKIMDMIGAGTSETRIIGIHGMGGIGKTTIAKIIYNRLYLEGLSKNFEGHCFLSNIRETSKLKGIHHLQHELISEILDTKWTDIRDIDEGTQIIRNRLSNKKVLILLDDVDHRNHMDALVGKRNWFGTGSKLIITTRNKDVLKVPEVDGRYEVQIMNSDQSLRLFSKHAFRRDSPLNESINQSNRAIGICGGLPLALKVIGSLLSLIEKEKWDDKLNDLENVPDEDIKNKLKISYNALPVREKHIFLDIACLFIGYDKAIVVHFWDKSKFSMEVLQNMSLISIEKDNKVWMHDLLRDLGRDIVITESNLKKEKQSRVWDHKEGFDLLRKHKGDKEVEALRLRLDYGQQYCFTYKGFESLSKLRFLEVDNWMENIRLEESLIWHESPSNVHPANENSGLLPQLRWLSWHRIPPTFNITNFSMEDVVTLDLSKSKITHDWQGWSHMEVMKNLKILNLTECDCLERTPIFSTEVNLERLILKGCTSLTEIDRSICHMQRLVSLDVSYCEKLQRLPDELGEDLASLEYLSLEHCESLERLPDTIGNLESLIELDISKTGIKELPDSIGKLKNLKVAKMHWNVMSKIPAAFWTIEKLEEIYAQFASLNVKVEIGNCISRNQSLRILTLGDARINEVPRLPERLIMLRLRTLHMDTFPDLSNLTNLEELRLTFGPCDDAGESNGPVEEYLMPRWIGNLSKLKTLALNSCYFVTHLPADFSSLLPRLQYLTLGCPNLRCLPILPSSLSYLYLCSEHMTALPTDISSLLPRLQELHLVCPNLRCLPSLPSGLSSLYLIRCESIGSLGDLSNLKNLSNLGIIDSVILEIRGLDGSENLDLQLSELQQVWILPDLSNLNQLRYLGVENCDNLVEIQGELPQSLESLWIDDCGSLQKLPDLSSLKGLRSVAIFHCGKLNVEAISLLCSEKGIEFLGDNELEGEDDESG